MSDNENKGRSNPLEHSTLFGNASTPPSLPTLPITTKQTSQPQSVAQPTPATKPERPKPPETRVRTGKKFVDRHVQETFYVDKRLLPYLYQLVESYPSKVSMTTAMIVQACRERGIEIPDDWQQQPFPE